MLLDALLCHRWMDSVGGRLIPLSVAENTQALGRGGPSKALS